MSSACTEFLDYDLPAVSPTFSSPIEQRTDDGDKNIEYLGQGALYDDMIAEGQAGEQGKFTVLYCRH